jgi:dihydrofolate reductase
MAKLIYSMGVSLDGYIAGPGGDFRWATPDEELHRFHNQQARETSVHLYGRRLYETMRYWETAAEDPSLSEPEREFAEIWRGTPKVVFSTTLDSVEGNATLRKEVVPEEIEVLKERSPKDLAVGGAGLAASFIRLGLIDEFHLFISPVVVGGGTPFFPPLEHGIELELEEARKFGSRVVYLRYRVANSSE